MELLTMYGGSITLDEFISNPTVDIQAKSSLQIIAKNVGYVAGDQCTALLLSSKYVLVTGKMLTKDPSYVVFGDLGGTPVKASVACDGAPLDYKILELKFDRFVSCGSAFSVSPAADTSIQMLHSAHGKLLLRCLDSNSKANRSELGSFRYNVSTGGVYSMISSSGRELLFSDILKDFMLRWERTMSSTLEDILFHLTHCPSVHYSLEPFIKNNLGEKSVELLQGTVLSNLAVYGGVPADDSRTDRPRTPARERIPAAERLAIETCSRSAKHQPVSAPLPQAVALSPVSPKIREFSPLAESRKQRTHSSSRKAQTTGTAAAGEQRMCCKPPQAPLPAAALTKNTKKKSSSHTISTGGKRRKADDRLGIFKMSLGYELPSFDSIATQFQNILPDAQKLLQKLSFRELFVCGVITSHGCVTLLGKLYEHLENPSDQYNHLSLELKNVDIRSGREVAEKEAKREAGKHHRLAGFCISTELRSLHANDVRGWQHTILTQVRKNLMEELRRNCATIKSVKDQEMRRSRGNSHNSPLFATT